MSEATSKAPVQNSHSQLRSHEETPQDYDCEPADFIDPEDFQISRSEAYVLGRSRQTIPLHNKTIRDVHTGSKEEIIAARTQGLG